MLKVPRVAVCLPALLAVLASGCGSTNTASTTTTIASTPTSASTNTGNTGTTLPAVKNAKTATQSTGAKHTTVAGPTLPRPLTPQRRAAEDKRLRREGALENSTEVEEAARASSEIAPPHQYPRFFQIRFIVSCENAKGSHSSCECILTKSEKSKVEKGHSLAELLALELEFKKGIPLRRVAGLPRRVQRITNECRSK